MRVKGIFRGLQDLAKFLNAIGPRTTPAQWRAFLNNIRPLPLGTGRRDRPGRYWEGFTRSGEPSVSVDTAKELSGWLNKDLAFLRADGPLDRPFDALVERNE